MKCALIPAFALAGLSLCAQSTLPAYHAKSRVSGSIRIWGHGAAGHDYIETLVRRWEEEFNRHQPGVTFDNKLMGTASAIGALYTGAGDLALLGREIWPSEIAAFREIFHYDPLGIEILTGSLDVRNKDFALTVMVHKDNPLTRITLAQVEAVFGAPEHDPVRSWGQLGLTGDWSDRPIGVYGFGIGRGFAYYIEQTIFHGSPKWNPGLREFGDLKKAGGSLLDAGQRIADALAKDRYGIAYASMLYKNPEIRALALSASPEGPFVLPTKQTVADRSYPLTRVIPMILNRAPGKPVEPRLDEFLRFILSAEGQRVVLEDGGYLPLNPDIVRGQLAKLR